MTTKDVDRASSREQHPLAFEERNFWWNIQRVPATLPDGRVHPGRSSAVFVVHGMGEQRWTETAAQLRSGFEDAFDDIAKWQKRHPEDAKATVQIELPPPFIWDGYWANYDDVAATFPEDFFYFNERERLFFGNLWKHRIISGFRTITWALKQQLRLLHPRVLLEVGPFVWLLYWPLQLVWDLSLALLAWRFPRLITGFLNDVRLYVEPRGVVERAIVQRIDERVMSEFLQMIGLDREFRRIKDNEGDQLIIVGGEARVFDRVVWVAHSLGTVISYNVLSALFHKAEQIELSGDEDQKSGVARFRGALARFVTMGSPLNKVAFLFKEKSLRPWPITKRRTLLESGERLKGHGSDPTETEWWINFYSVFDPVSGPLHSSFIYGEQPPLNVHVRTGWLPVAAHIAYWTDSSVLRFILGRTYGREFLRDRPYHLWPPWFLSALTAASYLVWAAILFGIPAFGCYAAYRWGPELLRTAGSAVLKWITG